ncbi:DUF6474 family protein [Rhodococcus kroppenstedtii]|uniref:DUF6474 family protein n=1 Tax=Rhodococcoides kroppenstedtii TaxID=293050 RepID=UPI00295548D6|nr:DUF6474 family protein [Rhodococcus kroppenstedtii]MDV7199001.1 DUF6474 family protein [Rhodococcus kroppenstedtii]
MGLLTKKSRRATRKATRKAEAKALRHKAGLEAKYSARNERKHLKKLAKNDAKALASQQKTDEAYRKALAAREQRAREGKVNPAKVRKWVGIGRVLAPVLVPIAYRAATAVRGQLDQSRAARLGVDVKELGQYTGHGAKLSARIVGAEKSLKELETTHRDTETGRFVEASSARLSDLTTAVHAAEQMPPKRRSLAHGAISDEIDGIEADILARLGVR